MHSLREGFGRCVIEGRLAGSRVVCSDIREFSTQRDEMHDREIYLYNDRADFMATLDRLAHTAAPPAPFDGYPYRAICAARSKARSEFQFCASAVSMICRQATSSSSAALSFCRSSAVWTVGADSSLAEGSDCTAADGGVADGCTGGDGASSDIGGTIVGARRVAACAITRGSTRGVA